MKAFDDDTITMTAFDTLIIESRARPWVLLAASDHVETFDEATPQDACRSCHSQWIPMRPNERNCIPTLTDSLTWPFDHVGGSWEDFRRRPHSYACQVNRSSSRVANKNADNVLSSYSG